MSERLLHEYLTLIIEKIKSKRGMKGPLGDHFDLNRFKKLDDLQPMLVYAGHFLDKLGEGSSRAAFLLSGKYVLKIALNKKGLAQNNAELEVFTNPKSKSIVAKIYASNDQQQWLIADLVKPVASVEEFEQMCGVSWTVFSSQIVKGLKEKDVPHEASKFVKTVLATALENNLLPGDLAQTRSDSKNALGHWGKTPDGRLVLLDYGFTEKVASDHYMKPQAAPGMVAKGQKHEPSNTVNPGNKVKNVNPANDWGRSSDKKNTLVRQPINRSAMTAKPGRDNSDERKTLVKQRPGEHSATKRAG